jgi:molybdenum cofactor biosynthesis protein MoaC
MNDEAKQNWSMADVSAKAETKRVAIAGGRIVIGAKAMEMLQAGTLPKGDPRAMAEVAGIQAAKQTPSLIPLCHPISLNRVMLRSTLKPEQHAIDMYCMAEIAAKTGVEMEALTGLNIALLTVWDLIKPVEPALEITGVRLLYKSGGKSGVWQHPQGFPAEIDQWIKKLDAGSSPA